MHNIVRKVKNNLKNDYLFIIVLTMKNQLVIFFMLTTITIVNCRILRRFKSNIERDIIYEKELNNCVNTFNEVKNTNIDILETIFNKDCEKGQYFDYDTSIKTNKFTCINCPINTYKKNNKCVECPPGYTSTSGSEQCILCTEQMFKNKECTQPSTSYCPSNTHISIDGCKECPKNSYQLKLNQDLSCKSCPENKKLLYSIFSGFYCE